MTEAPTERALTDTRAEANGRAPDGRFAQGNAYAKGNPINRRMRELKAVALAAVSDEDMAAIFAAMVKEARSGDVAAARLICEFTLGKPQLQVKLDLEDRDVEPYVDRRLQDLFMTSPAYADAVMKAEEIAYRELERAAPELEPWTRGSTPD